jgi:hypothetical protein
VTFHPELVVGTRAHPRSGAARMCIAVVAFSLANVATQSQVCAATAHAVCCRFWSEYVRNRCYLRPFDPETTLCRNLYISPGPVGILIAP